MAAASVGQPDGQGYSPLGLHQSEEEAALQRAEGPKWRDGRRWRAHSPRGRGQGGGGRGPDRGRQGPRRRG
eukprot:1664126-Alexandrium_andersonii.AAC.1